jgi:hypothetical protein
MAYSNVPSLLLVIDAKQNHLYYGWLRPGEEGAKNSSVLVPLVEVNPATQSALKRQFRSAHGNVAVAG